MIVVAQLFSLVVQPIKGNPCGYESLPSLSTTVIHVVGFLITAEITFYYTHRYCMFVCM